MKKKKGFTLVELLAVIVILAVILIIAVPRITDVINNSKKASFESSAKTIAAQAEKKYMEQQVLGNTDTISCSDIANINSTDYASCTITFDASGNASVSITGSGKFAGLTIRNATKNSATATELTETAAKYFSYDVNTGDAKEIDYYDVAIENQSKCESYSVSKFSASQEQATTLCTGGIVGEANISIVIEQGYIPSSDYENAGLKVNVLKKYLQIDEGKCTAYLPTIEYDTNLCTDEDSMIYLPYIVDKNNYDKAGITLTDNQITTITITGYNVAGGLDVVIPSEIDGKTVVAIADNAFTTDGVAPTGISNTNNNYKISKLNYNDGNNYVVKKISSVNIGLGIKSVIIPNTITSIGESAFKDNQLANVVIPNSVTSIGDSAFNNNQLTSITIPNTITSIGASAFSNNQLASIVIPKSVTSIGNFAFENNQLTSITFPTTPITITDMSFYNNPITDDDTYTYPSNVTVIISEPE